MSGYSFSRIVSGPSGSPLTLSPESADRERRMKRKEKNRGKGNLTIYRPSMTALLNSIVYRYIIMLLVFHAHVSFLAPFNLQSFVHLFPFEKLQILNLGNLERGYM